jgi:hypothetical protein
VLKELVSFDNVGVTYTGRKKVSEQGDFAHAVPQSRATTRENSPAAKPRISVASGHAVAPNLYSRKARAVARRDYTGLSPKGQEPLHIARAVIDRGLGQSALSAQVGLIFLTQTVQCG